MERIEFLERLNCGECIESGSKMHLFMHKLSQEAIMITSEINSGYHTHCSTKKIYKRKSIKN